MKYPYPDGASYTCSFDVDLVGGQVYVAATAQQVNVTITGPGGFSYTVDDFYRQSPYPNGKPASLPVGDQYAGMYSIQVNSWLGNPAIPGAASFYWDGHGNAQLSLSHTVTLHLAVTNNLGRPQTIACTNTSSQTLPASSSATLTFVVTGPPGTSAHLSSSPDELVFNANYDPVMVAYSDATVERAAHIGTSPATRKVSLTVLSYSTVALQLPVSLDGVNIGTVGAGLSLDGINPTVTSYAWNLSMSPDSSLMFDAPPGHTAAVSLVTSLSEWAYTVAVDRGAVSSSTTKTPDGTTTVTTTDPNTGTTSITRTATPNPTNTNTSPATVFGGTTAGTVGTVNTYGNTTPQAGSAATQDAANSLAGMAADMKQVRTNSDTQEADRVSWKAQTKGAQDMLGDGTQKSQEAVTAGSTAGNQMKTAVTDAISGKFGTAPNGDPIAEPAAPPENDEDVIVFTTGPGKEVRVHTNPFCPNAPQNGLVRTTAALIKRLIAWAVVVWFMFWVAKEVDKACQEFFRVAPFSKSIEDSINSLKFWGFGGGVGYLARTAGLLIVGTLVLTMPVAIVAASTAGLPWTSLLNTSAAGHGVAAATTSHAGLGTAWAYANYVLPMPMLIATPAWYLIVLFGILPTKYFWLMLKQFIPL